MKQNGMRLVQRKFAQGVPIPASSASVPPAPPERKAEPPNPPKNVYHNNMSARSLLDIVSMQNIHKHKQEPLVVLERLREDEIPPPPAPYAPAPAPARCVRPPSICVPLKRRKIGGKCNMSLRSGKRKPTDAGKGPIRKRKKLSSESTDDIPLVYFFNNRPAKPHHGPVRQKNTTDKKDKTSEREKRTAPKRSLRRDSPAAERLTPRPDSRASDDRSFTLTEPATPARLSYRLFKPKATAATARQVKKGVAKDTRWSSLRSARVASETRGVVRRPSKLVLGKKPLKPAVKKAVPKANNDVSPASPPRHLRFKVPLPPLPESNEPTSKPGPSGIEAPTPVAVEPMNNEPTSKPGPSGIEAPTPVAFEPMNNEPTCKPGPSGSEAPTPVSVEPDNAPTPQMKRRESLESVTQFLAANEELRGESPMSSADIELPALLPDRPSPVPSFSSDYTNEEDWCLPRAANDSPASSDFSDIIRLGTPPREPSVELPIAANLQLDAEIISASVDKELAEIKRPEEWVATDSDINDEEVVAIQQNSQVNKNNAKELDTDKNSETAEQNEQVDKTKRVKGKGVGKKSVPKKTPGRNPEEPNAPKEPKKTLPKRAARTATPQEIAGPSTSTRLLRNSREPSAAGSSREPSAAGSSREPPAAGSSREPHTAGNPDVYEFDAELEASRPPSGLRRRDPELPDTPESIQYVDICPASAHFVKITPKNDEDDRESLMTVSLVFKNELYKKQKTMIDNVTNRPALLNKLFNSLPTELRDELGNLATSEQNRAEAYLGEKVGSVLEAPTFYPTAEEFEDPIKYYDKIAPQASKYGLCKIVPPDGFKPECTVSDTIRFAVIYQYISKMYSRWGPVSRELAAIKAHLRTQSVVFARSPLLDGSEVNLPKLYHAVERNGGLSKVIQCKRWGRVAEEMKLTKLQHPERKLDPVYMRYLLPYATLSDQERQSIMAAVEKCWTTKYQKMLERARNPFQRQHRMLGTECESESDDEAEDANTAGALHEAEDCIVQGRTMNLLTFKKIATSLMDAHFEPATQPPSAVDVEKAYWRAVLLGTDHIVANTASIDTGEEGYGFPKDPQAEYGTHPWNLKVLARNPNNVLRYLGAVLGVTVPTLHLSMLFSTSCWHRDPHGLPWTEYLHSGAEKIWYGIPRDESANFRRAVETLCPAYCQNKSIWLASEITMVPPNILSEHGVKLSRLQQKPGEYVLVFPEAHTCSITTGFGISESVYFASNAWLTDVYKLFQELRNSCEPTMFSLEQLLLSGSADSEAPLRVRVVLATLVGAELEHRRELDRKGLKVHEQQPQTEPLNTSYFRTWNTRAQDECEYCRSTLFLSKVTGLTGRKSAFCPEHALRLLESKKYRNIDLQAIEFVSSYSTSDLEEMVERLETRFGDESRATSVVDLTGPSAD